MDRRQLLQGTAALGAAAALPRGQETAGAEERPPRPNVLLIFPDQLRAASVGCYGDPRAYPNALGADAPLSSLWCVAVGFDQCFNLHRS